MTTFAIGPRQIGRVCTDDLFDAWLFAENDASLALAAWSLAASHEKADAYAAYLAALDREAHAADILEQRMAA